MAEPEHDELDHWLHQLYGTTETGWLAGFTQNRETGERHIPWAPVHDLHGLAQQLRALEPTSCVWLGAATRHQRTRGRGQREDCATLPGLWVDIDIAGPGHRQTGRLARDRNHAWQLANAFPLPPTAVINTGGGLQPWWLLNEHHHIDDTTDTLLAAWGATWNRLAEQHDIDLDNVWDPARVLRVPGTTNRKEGLARPVTIAHANWNLRYGLDDLEQHLDPPPTQPAPKHDRPAVPYIGPERPGDAYNLQHTGHEILTQAGFTHARTDHNGDQHYVRPGKNARDGTSATVYNDDGHTTIWSDTVKTMWPAIETMRPYDPFGLYVAITHNGDFEAATTTLRDAGYGAPPTALDDLLGNTLQATRTPDAAHTDWSPNAGFPPPVATPRFPVDALPEWLANQARNVTQQLDCDPNFPAALTLAALSVATLGRINIQIRAGQTERTTGLYMVFAGPPSSGKSSALNFLFEPIRNYEKQAIATAEKATREHARRKRQLETDLDSIDDQKAREANEELSKLTEPDHGELITSNYTPEGVTRALLQNRERIAIVSDEAGALVVDRYGDTNKPQNLDIYLQGFTGEYVAVHRASAPPIRLNRPLLAVIVGAQPEALDAVMADPQWRTRGLGARFLTIRTDQLARNVDIDQDTWDTYTGDTYTDTITAICERLNRYDHPATLTIHPDARRTYSAWAKHILEREETGDLIGESGWASKLRSSAIRIAALLQIGETPHGRLDEITDQTMKNALRIADFFIAMHLHETAEQYTAERRLLDSMARIAAAQEAGVAQTGVRHPPFVARRELSRRGPRGLRKREEMAQPLLNLALMGLIRPENPTPDANVQVTALVEQATRFEVHPDAARILDVRHRATPRDTTPETPPEMHRDTTTVAHVAHVAEGDFETTPTSEKAETEETPRATRATCATPPPTGPVDNPPVEADPQKVSDDVNDLF